MFRIVEYTNYHLSSILTDNGYGLEKCGVVGEWNLTTDTGGLYMKEKVQGGLPFPQAGLTAETAWKAGKSELICKHGGSCVSPISDEWRKL